MSKIIILFTLPLILFISCNETKNTEIAELTLVVEQLKSDKNNEFLMTLKPSEKDCRLIFQKGQSANKVVLYSEMEWVDAENIPENSMKPITTDAEFKILSATKKELIAGISNGLPVEYVHLGNHLKDGITIYAMKYLNEDGTEQKLRAAFFKVSEKWIIIPRTFKAFE